MATLTLAQKAVIQSVIDFQAGNYEKPLDGAVAERLSKLHAAFGFDSQIVFLEGLRDKPFSTLLQALLAVAA